MEKNSTNPKTTKRKQTIEIFYSYAHEDEQLRKELEKHLSLLQHEHLIANWKDRDITGGEEWAGKINLHLQTAHIILLLVSPDFMASKYCYSLEMKEAMKRHKSGDARVIPIILRPVDWRNALFSKLQALPKDGKPITTWANQDEAFLDVTQGIRRVVEELRNSSK